MQTTNEAALQIKCLGRTQIVYDGELLSNSLLKKAQALLIYLALEAGQHERESLAALLWSDMPGEKARANLRTIINRLRQPLGEYLDVTHQTVAFNPIPAHWIDVTHFVQGLTAASPSSQRGALALYHGDFLYGFIIAKAPLFEEWALVKREHLRALALDALARLAEDAQERGDIPPAIADLRRLLALDPWREAAHRALMRALAASGDRAAALAQYETCRHVLAEELAVEPAPETAALYEQIRAGELEASVKGTVTLSPRHPVTLSQNNLPAETTPFVGRHEELAQIAELLTDPACRLLTLFGLGGIGKTRLALKAARQAVSAFSDGVYLVSLEAVASTDLLVTTITGALTLSLSGQQEPKAQLLAYLRERQMLLLLDNFEHLLAGSPLLVELLQAAPGLKLLVTSRERLNLYEEWLLEVPGLSYPTAPVGAPSSASSGQALVGAQGDHEAAPDVDSQDLAQFDAANLFLHRARRAYPRFTLSGNETAVAEICHLLLGMPLGIELAAAWMYTVSAPEIARQIATDLDILTTSLRNVPARQRSMLAVFNHSWELLAPEEKRLLRQLSVFRGGFTTTAAREVVGAGPQDLSSLTDKALLQITPTGRYGMHPLIRQYAADKLAVHLEEQAESLARHAAYYAAFLAQEETAVQSRERQEAFQRIAGELDNLRVAWTTAVAQQRIGQLDQMVGPLYQFYGSRGLHQEGTQRFDQALDALRQDEPSATEPQSSRLLARLLVRQGRLSEHISRDFGVPQRLLAEGLGLARQHNLPAESAEALLGLGLMNLMRGQPAQAGAHLQESLQLCHRKGIHTTMANVLVMLAWLWGNEGKKEEAKALCQEAITIHQDTGDMIGVAAALTALGKIHGDIGELAEAEAAYTRALTACRHSGHRVGEGQALTGLFSVCYRRHDLDKAAAYARESLAVNRDVGNRLGMAIAYHNLGYLAASNGQHQQAVDHYHQALAIYETMEVDGIRQSNTRRYLAESLLALGETEAAAVQQELAAAHLQ